MVSKVKTIIIVILIALVAVMAWRLMQQSAMRATSKSRMETATPATLDSLHDHYNQYVLYANAMQIKSSGQQVLADSMFNTLLSSSEELLQTLAAEALQPKSNTELAVETDNDQRFKPKISISAEEPREIILKEQYPSAASKESDINERTTLQLISKQGKRFDYMGAVERNMANGFGVGIYETGSIYKGHWKQNMKHGQGEFKWKDGEQYKGTFANDYREGKGVYRWTNGEYYEGAWKKDQRNGFGILYKKNGKIKKKGIWKDDIFVERVK